MTEYMTKSGLYYVQNDWARDASVKMAQSGDTSGIQVSTIDAVQRMINDVAAQQVYTKDAFSNYAARTGFLSPNLMEGTEYPLTRLTQDYQLCIALYRNHWIIRKIIDGIPEDMTKNWIRITSEIEPKDINKFDRMWNYRRFKDKILLGLKWGRLYGGALGIMAIKGHEDILDLPLDPDDILPGAFANIIIVDRWSGAYPSEELVTDINDPEFGLPKYYVVNLPHGDVVRVHHSRALRFVGRHLPYWEQLAEVYWGASEIEIVFEELRKRDNVSWNIAMLTFLANLRVVKQGQLAETLAIANTATQKRINNMLQAQNWLMSNMSMLLLNKDDDFQTHQWQGAGLNEIYESFMMDVSGASGYPVTKLFGRSPAGMNATGESDMQNYYETLQQNQSTYLAPVLNKVLPVLSMSLLGRVPDDLDYEFNPVRTPTDDELANIVQQKTQAIVNVHQEGLISNKIALMELKQMSMSTGMFSNITDEDIENADDAVGLQSMIPPSDEGEKDAEGSGQETRDWSGLGANPLEAAYANRDAASIRAQPDYAENRPWVDKVRDALRHIRLSRGSK